MENLPIVESRNCGPCTACCTFPPIPAGTVSQYDKPSGESCPRLCSSGCVDYPARPSFCKEFQCTWLVDPTWPESWRPRESGLFCLHEELGEGVVGGLVYEMVRGVLQTTTAQQIVDRLLEKCDIVTIVDTDGGRQSLLRQNHKAPHFLKTSQQKV